MGTRGIAKLCGLCKELGGIFIVNEHDVINTPFMQEGKLVEGMRELCRSVLCGTLEPLDTFLRSLRQAKFAVEFGNAKPVQGSGVRRSGSFAVKLDGLCGLATTTPTVFAACTGAVGSVGMAVFCGEDEEREGAIKVLAVLVCAYAVRVTVGEEVLGRHVSTIGVALEEGGGLLYEVFALFDRLFDLYNVCRCGFGNGEGLGGVDHKDGKLELEVGILSFFGVGAIEFESSFVGQEGRLLSRPQVRMVKDRT